MSFSGKSSKLLALGVAVLFFAGLLASLRWIWLPGFLNSQDLKASICKQIQHHTGYSAKLESLELTSFFPMEIMGQGLALETPEGEPFLAAPRIVAKLGWRELLAGQVVLHSVIMEALEVEQPELLLLQPEKGGAGLLRLGQLRIRDSILRWPLAGQNHLLLRNTEADIHFVAEKNAVEFRLRGDIETQSWHWPVVMSGRLEPDGSAEAILEADSTPLAALSRFLFPGLEMDRVTGQSKIAIRLQRQTNGQLRWSGSLEAKQVRVNWPGMLDVPFETPKLKAEASGTWENGSWSVQEARINSQDLTLEGQLSGNAQGLRGWVRAGAFPFERVVPYLGRELIGPALYGFFREDLLQGKGKEVVFSLLAGDQKPNGNPNGLIMELEFEDAAIRFDPRLHPLEKLSGILVWQGDRVWFKNLKGQYRNHPFKDMEARITEIGKISLLEGRFSLELAWPELEELFSTVAPLKTKGPALSNLQGSAMLELGIRKAFLLKDPLSYEAKIQVNGAWGSIPWISGPWKVTSGQITATPKRVEIGYLKGTWDDSWWEAAGSMENWGEESPGVRFQGNMGVSSEQLQRALARVLPGMKLNSAQSVPLEFAIQGDLHQATARLKSDLSDTELSYKEIWKKPKGDALDLEVVIEGSSPEDWNLEEVRIRDGDVLVLAKRSPSSQGDVWNLSCSSCDVSSIAKRWSALKGRLEEGHVEISVALRSGQSLHWDASIKAREVKLAPEVAGSPLVIRSGNFQANPSLIIVESARLNMESHDVTFSGSIRVQGQDRFKVQGGLRGEELDLDSFLASKAKEPNGEREPQSSHNLKKWVEKLEDSELGLAFRSMRFMGLEFTGVQARILKKTHGISLEGYSGRLASGEVSMRGDLSPEGLWRLVGNLTGARSAELFPALGFKEALIEGTLGVDVDIQGGANKDSRGGYSGVLNLEIEKGLIRRFPVLASVLSMMNLTQLLTGRLPDLSSEGMVFTKIRGTFQLDQGILKTEDLRVESEAVVITMVGEIDLKKRQCDLKVGVQPFVGVDRFVDKLPVIRHYLAGPKRTVLATYFLVTGPLDQPEVNAIPFRSLGQTVMDMFLRLFQNPFADLGPPGTVPQEPEAPYGAR
ncbi:MAG: AsmA-like C-terminal domain-containing protein [bacterium]